MKQPPFWKSVGYACEGLFYMVRTQRNAKIHVIISVCVVGLSIWLGLGPVHISILTLTIGAVLAAEAINTAAESIVDLLSPEWHERAKVAKDVSAAAVLILSMTAVAVGLLILGPPLWSLLFYSTSTGQMQ